MEERVFFLAEVAASGKGKMKESLNWEMLGFVV
jgi:hypothetical protein